jgi:hypothetical protein
VEFTGKTKLIQGIILQAGSGEAMRATKIGNVRAVFSAGIHDPSTRKKVYVSIRPECLRLSDFPRPGNNTKNVIGNTTYFGEIAHFKFKREGVVLRTSDLDPSHFTNAQNKSTYASFPTKTVQCRELIGEKCLI